MKNRFILFIFLSLTTFTLSANNLSISGVSYNSSQNRLTFTVSWDNSFNYGGAWYDWAWVFVKYKNINSTQWNPLTLDAIVSDGTLNTIIKGSTGTSDDTPVGFGLKISGPTNNFGTAAGTVVLDIGDMQSLVSPSFKVFGIEMVHQVFSNGEDFYLGDGISGNRFHKGDDASTPYFLTSSIISIGNGPNDLQVAGGSVGGSSISSDYPKNPFSVMKYEISQQQYVEFLNTLTRHQQNNRVQTDILGTSVTNVYVLPSTTVPTGRNGIRCDAVLPAGGPITFYCDYNGNGTGNQTFDGQNIACNYLFPADLQAYLDWAGLRPMSEIEYEFLCRGTDNAVAGEFAWGTATKTQASINGSQGGPGEVPTNIGADGLVRVIGSGPLRCGFAATSTSNRSMAGATFYGAMEMTGNVSEMVVGIGTASELDFEKGDSGDGLLNFDGDGNESSWPAVMTWRGHATTFNSLQSVSDRNTGYVSPIIRSKNMGGRGVPAFN